MEYAARYWPVHAAACLTEAHTQEDLEDQIVSFFKQDLIRWFELTVVLKAVYQCIRNLDLLGESIPIGFTAAIGPTNKVGD